MRLFSTLLACVLCLSASTAFGDFINGDFDGGGTIQSDYVAVFSNTAPGQAIVATTPSAWGTFSNPPASGQVLMADGSTVAGTRTWFQDYSLTAGTVYNVSFDAVSINASSGAPTADLTMAVKYGAFNVMPVAWTGTLADSSASWTHAAGTFTAASSGMFEFLIGNNNISAAGNAFAIDNISIAAVPEPSSLALLGIGSLVGLGVYTRRRRKTA